MEDSGHARTPIRDGVAAESDAELAGHRRTPGDRDRTSVRNARRGLYSRVPWPRRIADPLAPFGPAVRAWFEATFEAPTPAQAEGWAAIAGGHHTLIHAPTGSGKTLAAFLWCLDRLVEHPRPGAHAASSPGTVRVLYVSPLKALTYDVERNLRAPLAGIALEAASAWATSRRASRSPRGPATPRPTSAATSSATRRTSSSRRPRACTSC